MVGCSRKRKIGFCTGEKIDRHSGGRTVSRFEREGIKRKDSFFWVVKEGTERILNTTKRKTKSKRKYRKRKKRLKKRVGSEQSLADQRMQCCCEGSIDIKEES